MYKDRYIELLLSRGVLRFGSYQTKSGRESPYFFNTGCLDSGQSLGATAEIYAEVIAEKFGSEVENLFGPAYKGIPLCVMAADRLARHLGRDISFTFNRKEAKDHGEGGTMVGRQYLGGEKVIVVEDVITGGTSFSETLPLLRKAEVNIIGLIVGIDRQERGQSRKSALQEISDLWGIPAASLVTISDVIARLHNRVVQGRVWIDDQTKERINNYLRRYGAEGLDLIR